MFLNTNLLDFLNILDSASVEDRKFRTVDLYETVVDAKGIEGCHTMLNSRNAHLALAEHCATLGVDDILGNGIYYRHAFEVDTLYLITMIFGSRIESHSETQSCMQAFSAKRETAF